MVSIIIPAFNAEKYLRECLDSAVGQTCRDVEIIVVDDGSKDLTGRIASEYASRDSRVKLFTKPNGGLSSARNHGVACSRGEWITFLDADDALFPDAVSLMLSVAGKHGMEIVCGGYVEGRAFSPRERGVMRDYTLCSVEAVEAALYQHSITTMAWGKLYSRRIVETERFTEGIWYEDIDFFYRAYDLVARIAFIDAPVYFYRVNEGSFLHTFTPSRCDVLAVTERIERYMERRHPDLLPAARDRRLSANFNMFCLLAVNDRSGRYSRIADGCWALIRRYRRESLTNPRVRLKNKIGILVSYLGAGMLRAVSPLVYGRN